MDVSDEKESGSIDSIADLSSGDGDISATGGLRSCADCRTTKTPLWRCGPSGPKSLCNACGIRYRKKRRPALGLKERDVVGERARGGSAKDRMEEKLGGRSNKKAESLKMTMMGFRREIFWKLGTLIRKQNRRRLGEEEEAAILLMAISSGLIYA